MTFKTLVTVSALLLAPIRAQQYVAFDAASASSTYSAGNLAGSPAYAAQQALSGGSGYWQRQLDSSDVVFGSPRVAWLQVFCWWSYGGTEHWAE